VAKILTQAISLVLIIIIGQVIKKIGWVNREDFPKFSKIVLRLTMPCAVITSFSSFNLSFHLLILTIIGIMANLIQQVTGYLINRPGSGRDRAFGINNIGSYNIAAFAMPYISGFIGAESLVYAALFDVGNSISAGGIGYGWSLSEARESSRPSVWLFVKNMLSSPIFVTYLVLLAIRLVDLKLPAAFLTFTSIIGSANPFLAMLMIGLGLELRLDQAKISQACKYLSLRYGFALAFTLLTLFVLPVPAEAKVILCMLYFAPIASMVVAFTGETEGDVELSAFMTSISVLLGIILIPTILLTFSPFM